MSSKSKGRRPQANMTKAVEAALTMFLWAYCEVYDPDQADMENISQEIQKVQEGVNSGRLRIKDIKQALDAAESEA